MGESIMEIGEIIKWKDMVNLVGKMEGNFNYKKQKNRIYLGNYVNDKKEGYGEFFWPDGR